MFSTANLVIFASLWVVVGIILGAFITYFWYRSRTEKVVQPAQDATLEQITPQPVVEVKEEDMYHSGLRLFYRKDGSLATQLDGQSVVSAAELSLSQRRQFENLLQAGKTWLEPTRPEASTPVKSLAAAPAPHLQAAASEKGRFGPAPRTLPTAEDAKSDRGQQPPAGPAKPQAPTSIVLQIDDILQTMLEKSPLASRAIRLREDPNSGVIVWVDERPYTGIDSVIDPDVIAVIRAAVVEWERRTEQLRR